MHISSFVKTGTDLQAILKLYLRNLKGYNFGFTDGRVL
jgi:hypothetical protein